MLYEGNYKYRKLNGLVLRLRLVDIETCCTLHIIHVAVTRMKRAGIDGLYRGYLLEVMMTCQNPLEFIPLNDSANGRSGGRIVSWNNSWWKDRKGAAWGGSALKSLSPDDWIELHTQDSPRICTPPPEAHTHIPHEFAIPSLMTHIWRRQLSKDVDVLFTINTGISFWPRSMHETLIVLIVSPLDHVSNYRGTWVLQVITPALEVQGYLEALFKHLEIHGCGKFHDL